MTLTVSAQRHIKGIKGVDLLGGVTGKGIYGEVGYNKYISNKVFYNIPLRYENAKIDQIKISSFSINPSLNYTFYKPWKWLYISAKTGGSIYADYISNTKPADVDYISGSGWKMNYGIFLGLETEIYLTDKLSWVLNFRQNYNFSPVSGNWVFYAGTGFRKAIF